jgi:hypothetical protein
LPSFVLRKDGDEYAEEIKQEASEEEGQEVSHA